MDRSILPGRIRGICISPGSKSYAQRALAASLLTEGTSVLHHIDFCNDTLSAISCIEALGAKVHRTGERSLTIEGGLRPQTDRLCVGESGLAARLFAPIVSLCRTPILIEGEGTLRHRPMLPMLETLRQFGVQVRDGGGFLPIEICGPLRGGEVTVEDPISSQFATGLLLALPLACEETTIRVARPIATPYLDMTIDTARQFGIEILHKDYQEFYIAGGQYYSPTEIEIESDWSAAALLLTAGAIAGQVTIRHLPTLSKQADTAVMQAFVRSGAAVIDEGDTITVAHRPLQAFSFDATHCPDLFPALAVLAAAANGTSIIRGTSRLENKENNRAESLKEEFEKLGIEIDLEEEDVMKVQGGKILSGTVESHSDHRIAMALSIAGLAAEGPVTIEGAECVAKSFPDFFERLDALRIR